MNNTKLKYTMRLRRYYAHSPCIIKEIPRWEFVFESQSIFSLKNYCLDSRQRCRKEDPTKSGAPTDDAGEKLIKIENVAPFLADRVVRVRRGGKAITVAHHWWPFLLTLSRSSENCKDAVAVRCAARGWVQTFYRRLSFVGSETFL